MTEDASLLNALRRALREGREDDVRRWAAEHHPEATAPVLDLLVTLAQESDLSLNGLRRPTADGPAPLEELYRAAAAAHH